MNDQQLTSERRSFFGKIVLSMAAMFPILSACAEPKQEKTAAGADAQTVNAMQQQLADLSRQLGILEDIHAVRCLQHKYGYYLDKCLYNETVDLFAEGCEVRFLGGIFKGKAGARRLYVENFQKNFTGGHNGPLPGFLLDHLQLQDVVDVAPDRMTAKARFRTLMQAGAHKDADNPMAKAAREQGGSPRQWWEGGIYENSYVKQDGLWKIKVLNYRPFWHADYDKGWAYTKPEYVPAMSTIYPENPTGPDELDPDYPGLWPVTDVVPFHYPHPVTGKMWEKA